MHRYWLRVCTNLALSIYWIQKKKWCYICSCIPPIVKLFTRKDTDLQRAQQPIACLMSGSTTKCVSPVSGSTTRATTLTRSASPPTISWTPSRAYATPLPAHVHTTYLSKEMAKIIWWRTLGEECFENHYDGWWTRTSAQSPYWSWRPVPLGEPLVSATGYWRTTNQGVWILENQTHLMCIGMDPLSIIVHVYNGTAHSPRSHLLCRADFQLWRLLTPWGMTTTCPTTSSGNTNNVSALRTWGRQCRRHPNTQAGSKRGYRRRNPRPNQLYGRLQ